MFPDYNIYSLPLLILVFQGILLAVLLFSRYAKKGKVSDLVLGTLVLVTCYHRTTYTIGFMGWYDTFRTTKINYYLISLVLAVGPLIYYYIKACITDQFRIRSKDLLHFFPVLLYVLLQIAILIYDRSQIGFDETQNGPLLLWVMDNLSPLLAVIFIIHLLTYLVFSFKLYYSYRKQLNREYSNTYKYELLWLRNFLLVYSFLFVYDSVQTITDGLIVDLHWTQEWWYQFFAVLVVLYVGVMGYFTKLDGFAKLNLESPKESISKNEVKEISYHKELAELRKLVEQEKLFLDPNLTLRQLSRKSKINPTLLSAIINNGTQHNFNDFINNYRVAAVKQQLLNPSKTHLSILAIAYECGFSSKATFNRVFKRIEGQSPSTFRKQA